MRALLLILLVIGAAPAAAQTPPDGPVPDPRIRTVPYDATQVIRLNVAASYQLTVIFDPAERVENVAIGDSEGWRADVNQRGDALFLKPLRQGGVTNMTVITSARVYSFELTSIYGPTPDSPFTVRFVYPDLRAESSSEPPVQPVAGRYRLYGPRALRPAAISDDGVRTYIEWGPTQALPAVFAVDERGDEILVEGHMRDGLFVVDAVHPRFLFRLDGRTARANRLRERSRR